MARYIKANQLVAKFLQLEKDRNTVSDGNYLLWQNDMLRFGPLTQLSQTLAQIGGISLMPHEAKEEQDGTVVRPLPQALDSRFIIPSNNSSTTEPETPDTGDGTENSTEGGDNTETGTEETPKEPETGDKDTGNETGTETDNKDKEGE